MFTYEVELPAEDGKGTDKVAFTLKPVGDVPVGILRRNRRNQEAQMWATFEWGLPAEQMDNFDRLTATQVVEMLNAWQQSSEAEQIDQDKPVGPPKTKKVTTPAPDDDAAEE